MKSHQAPARALQAGRRPQGAPLAGRIGVRAAILAGFALLVVLWLGAVIDLAFRVRQVDRELTAMTERFIRTEDALQTIRTSVLLAAIDWRDAFLDTEAERTSFYRTQLLDHQQQCKARLAELDRGDDAWIARDAVDALEREVDAYWAGVMPLIDMVPLQRAIDVRRILNERVLPKRALVVRIVQQVQQLNRERFQRQQREAASLYTQAQTRVAATGGLATLLSLIVGALVFVHVSRLERQLRSEFAANTEITADLHRLSARLVRAQEDERRLIARELHDEVGQALTAVKMQLSVARRAVAPERQGSIDEARAVVDSALQSARNLSRLLHPPMLDDMGLAAALDWFLRGFSERTGIPTSLEHTGMERRAAPEIETCLFRVVQEATTNVARHAGATHCRLYVQRLPNSIVLTIEDDGRGFDLAAARASDTQGLGLLGIQERVAGFRGTFRLDSTAGNGTRLTVELPVLNTPAAGEGPADDGGGSDDLREGEEDATDGANPAR